MVASSTFAAYESLGWEEFFGERSGCRQHQIGQTKQREQLRRVFRQPAVTGLAMSKQVLDDVEGMLDFCKRARLEDRGGPVGLDRIC